MKQDIAPLSMYYILTGITSSDTRVYYDTDAHSGGYPYWSNFVSLAKQFNTLAEVHTIQSTDWMLNGVIRIETLQVFLQAKVLVVTNIISPTKAKALAEIDKLRKELDTKLATLAKM